MKPISPEALLVRVKWWQWLVLAALSVFALAEYLNFTGFCYTEGRYLNDAELVKTAIRFEIENVRPLELSRGAKRYGSVAEFREMNPNCCFLTRGEHPALEEGTWIRVYGWYLAVAELWYRYKESGPRQYWYEVVYVDSCGGVRGRTGHEESIAPTGIWK